MIVFSGTEFIFRFLPVFLVVYYLTPARHRDITLLLGSIFVYATVDIRYLLLLLALTAINYYLGERILADRSGAPAAAQSERVQTESEQLERVRELFRNGIRSEVSADPSPRELKTSPAFAPEHETADGGTTGEIIFHDIFAEEEAAGKEREKEAFAEAKAHLMESLAAKEKKKPAAEKPAERKRPEKSETGNAPAAQLAGRTALLLAVAIDVASLILCKYLALNVQSFIQPLGMSFYIFKMISYQADLYRGVITHRPGFVRTAAYFTMFPQITQGPIMRYGEGEFDSEKPRRVSAFSIENGVVFFVIGLSFKVLLADRLGILWNEIAKIGYESISTPLAWMGAFCYSFQLYFDFWGYSLMAGGLGLMLGFPFIMNFRHPYLADGIADFYRRWHLTLGNWFRDYVYIPMGGSRKGALRTILNLLIVWGLTGLWHGGTLNFIIWGLVLGILIILEKFLLKGAMRAHPAIGHFHVWFFIPLTWVIFAIDDLKDLGMYFTRLFPFFGTGVAVNHLDFWPYLKLYLPYFAVAALLSAMSQIFIRTVRNRRNPIVLLLLLILFWVCVYYMVTTAGNAFMYFSF